MRAARGDWPLDTPKVERNRAIVQARKNGLSLVEVARLFGVSASRVHQICTRAALAERFEKERTESGGKARVRTLGAGTEAPGST
jgi:transposase-like protein